MEKFFSFQDKKGGSSLPVTSSLRDGSGIPCGKRIGTSSSGWGYNIRDKDLKKIHKVAIMGNVRKLQKVLIFGKHGVNERDKMNRTALHLACASGHPDVVALLVERKCQLNFFDGDYRTALMKAVQCQNERCVTILLEHGADPNLVDIAGNTALHYATVGSNTSIAEKLLLHHANIEARNKDEFTPFLLAVSKNKQQMVEFLIQKEANVHAVDKSQRTALMLAVHHDSADLVRVLLQQGIDISSEDANGWTAEEYSIFSGLKVSRQLIAEHREEKLNNYLQNKNPVADKISEEESLSSISIKPGTDDSWLTSDAEDLNFGIQSISESLPKKDVKRLSGAADQKGPRILNEEVEDLPGERDLERTSEEEEKRLDERDNKHLQDKVILQTCILAEKTSENQTKQINVPLLHLQKKSREPEMNKNCDREARVAVYSEHPPVQKHEELWIKQGKLEWKKNLKLITSELKRKFGKTCQRHKIGPYPKEESLHGNFKEGANVMEIPSNLTNDRLDCEKRDTFAVPVPLVFQAFAEQKTSSLKYAWQSSSDFALSENKSDCENGHKPDTEHVFNKNKSFKSDTENKKVRNPLAMFEVKEDQELDMPMAKSMNQNSTNSKLEMGHIPQSSHSESLCDKRFSSSNEVRQMAQIKRHNSSAVTDTYKKTKDLFRKPFCADNDSTNNYRSMEPEEENESSSPPCSYGTSEVYLKEEIQQDVQKVKNEIGMLQIDFLDLEKEKVQLQKEINEKKRQQSNGMAVFENVCVVAAAGAAGLIPQRESGKTENHLFPFGKKEDSDGSDRGLHMKEVRKDENEKWTSKVSVITPGLEKADSVTSCPLQVNDESTSGEMDQDEGRPAKKTSHEKKEVKKQMNFMDDLDLTESSGTASEGSKLPCSNYMSCVSLPAQVGKDCKDSASLLKIQDAILSYKRLVEQLKRKNKKMENKVNGLQKELSETNELKSQLEHQKVKWEQELGSLRFTLKREKEKRRNADILYEKMREQFREKEEQYNKEIEMKHQLELSLGTLDVELRTVRNNLDQVVEERNDAKLQLSQEQNARVLQDGILKNHLCKQTEMEVANNRMNSGISNSHEKEEDLLPKTHMWQDEIAMLRLDRDTINNKNQDMEKKYCEGIEIIKEKNVSLQEIIKLKVETLTKTILEYSGQINALTTENTMLKSKLENEKQNKDRLDRKVESYRARLATAIEDYDQSQASKRDLELAFQRAEDEWFRLQDKLKFDVSNLKENNELLSQNLSKAESKFNTLEIELHHTRDALREKTLALECVQRDLSQTQCQKKEMKHMYQNEHGKQESLEERLSQLQSENMLLQQQLDDAHNKAASKENVVINIQDQFQDIIKKLQAESEKQGLWLEERNKELINECNLLKERMYQYEKEKAEREVAVRHLQLELADALKKQSMSEASLEVTSRCRINLEDETQDLRKKLGQIRHQA